MNNLNYGVIGNCRTAALISQNGNIEWLCFPDFDSPSIFASMLDREKGGAFGFEVSGDYRITQNYVPHTNILSTQFSQIPLSGFLQFSTTFAKMLFTISHISSISSNVPGMRR